MAAMAVACSHDEPAAAAAAAEEHEAEADKPPGNALLVAWHVEAKGPDGVRDSIQWGLARRIGRRCRRRWRSCFRKGDSRDDWWGIRWR